MSGYSEDTLVEQPTIKLLAELGWETVRSRDLNRETQSDAILTARLRPALKRLNPHVPPEAIDQAIAEITRDRSQMSMVAANRELGMTIAIVTHELLSIERLDGRLFMLDQGQVAFTGTVAEAKCSEHPVVRSFFHPSDSSA